MLSSLQIRNHAGQVFNARVGTILDPMCKVIYETLIPNNMFFNLMFAPDYDYAILLNLETKSDNESCLHLKVSRLQM
jgi:hypothetical protein